MENLTHAHGVLPSAPLALCASCAGQAGDSILIPAMPCANIVVLQEVEEFEKTIDSTCRFGRRSWWSLLGLSHVIFRNLPQ